MWRIFGSEIVRFSILVVFALEVFGLFWLYFDAWKEKKVTRTVPLLLGFVFLSLSFLLQGTNLETQVLTSFWTGAMAVISKSLYLYLRVAGYLFIIWGLLMTPLEDRPKLEAISVMGGIGGVLLLKFSLPILAALVFILYWRRASLGLENHIRKVAVGFGVLSVFEVLSLAELFRGSSEVWISKLVAPFGVINVVQYLVLLVAGLIFSRWTWYYLLKRLSTQLFMLSISGAVILSLVITGVFVSLLLKSVEAQSLSGMEANAKVVSGLLKEKQERVLSQIKLLAKDEVVVLAIESGDKKLLTEKVKLQMKEAGLSSLVITDSQGRIILKGENEEERGTSWSDDAFVKKSLIGETVFGVVAQSGVLAPEVLLRVSVPAGKGVIVAAQTLDNAFVDGVKTGTGLAISIYGDKLVSATTEDVGDGKTRLIGLKETSPKVNETVWGKGEVLSLSNKMGDREYLSAYVPLKNQVNETVAAMQVSQLAIVSLRTTGQAVQMTFMMVIAVVLFLSLPIYWVCQRIVSEWE